MNKVYFYTTDLEQMTANLSAILSVDDIATFLQVSQRAVYKLISNNKLPAFIVPGESGYNVYKKDFILFLQKNETINF